MKTGLIISLQMYKYKAILNLIIWPGSVKKPIKTDVEILSRIKKEIRTTARFEMFLTGCFEIYV